MRTTRLPTLSLVVSLLLLSACAVPRPPEKADAPMPPTWSNPLPASTAPLPHGGSLPTLGQWWEQLHDPLLVDLIFAAESVSPTVASAGARIAEARATRVAAGAALIPNLNGQLAASRGNSPTSGFTGTSTSGTTGLSTSLPILTTGQAGLQSSWEIDLFGGLRANRDASQARLAGADARWHDARVSVAAETANTYLDERACRRQLVVSTSDAQSRAETARLTDLSMRAGFTAPADAALARASAAEASGRLTQQRAQCALLEQALVSLTGIEAPVLRARLEAAPIDVALPAVQAVHSVPAEALAQRPDVYAAELGVAAASADAGAALAQRFPRLTLQGSIATVQVRTGGFRETFDTWTIGPLALNLPIFDGGTLAANEAAAKVRYDEAVALYRASVRQAVREVEEALINLRSTDERAEDADTAVNNYQASFDATQARFGTGLASLFDLESARRTLFASQTSRVSLQRERAEAWVALYRAMGGGWTRPESIATTAPAAAPSSP
ncbi:efflux transporter, outer membrane factor (OMF) lipoprotein, NodT family [Variovorax sp. HW608]|uniref:efflux transporter outer membrane subunit n=1 Tax=Variovorax sp. HW608 TaxID=1034889 RepID=UPI00081FA200|nr:efflux transporter outer membrane subunit [Variovorax sp. HW608]SCK52773.1 efflux transporter, outer membrane factor (OMF) lipoprotein, NodT family [Variovorax sp. HW608]